MQFENNVMLKYRVGSNDYKDYGEVPPYSCMGYIHDFLVTFDGDDISLLEKEGFLDAFGTNNDTFLENLKEDWIYFYSLLYEDIDGSEDLLPQLNACNSVKMKKNNFVELINQWSEDISVNKPEFILLWQDEQYKVYLESFEDEDSVRKRVDEVKRVVGEEEVED